MKPQRLAQKLFTILSYVIQKEMHPKNTVTFFSEIDCTVIDGLRAQYQREKGVKPSYTAFIAQAVAKAIQQHPYTNARIFPGLLGSSIKKFENIDVAIANEKDFPGAEFFAFLDVIRGVDQLPLLAIHKKLYELARSDETNNEQLKAMLGLARNFPTWLGKRLAILPTFSYRLWKRFRGASVLISSPAKYGVDVVAATWAHPIGISFGLVQEKPMVKDGVIQSVLSFTLTLNFDRRIIAGAPAARFFSQIIKNLANPAFEADASNVVDMPRVA